jgi:hypothetical protein
LVSTSLPGVLGSTVPLPPFSPAPRAPSAPPTSSASSAPPAASAAAAVGDCERGGYGVTWDWLVIALEATSSATI